MSGANDPLSVLRDPSANWERRPGASAAAVRRLVKSLGKDVPADYLTFLRYSDGGSGMLDVVNQSFRLDPAGRVVAENTPPSVYVRLGLLRIGMCGGVGLAFDRAATPWKVREVHFYQGLPRAGEVIAVDFAGFARLMGRWKPKPRRRVPAESAAFDAFGRKAFWERFIFGCGNSGAGPEFPELDDVTVDFRPDARSRSGLSLELDVHIDMYTLFLTGGRGRTQLGWCDEGQWRPYCLRWEELLSLADCIAARAPDDRHKALPLLLLSRFVPAVCVNDQGEMRKVLTGAWKRLGLLKPAQISNIVDGLMCGGKEGDGQWAWRRKPNLGWVLTGKWAGEYSLRSEENEKFPFRALERLLGRFASDP